MSVTFTATYRDVLSAQTVTLIDRLTEDTFDLGCILEFIDEHSEEEFREYYEDYVEAGETHGYEAVDYFVNEVADLSELERFEDAYIGEYSSPARMAEDFLEHDLGRIPYFVVVDYEATAEYLLDHEVDRHGDHYFRCCY
jgi:hypothetical protein